MQGDGTRHVIFQDINNQLREAVVSSIGNGESWDVSTDNIVATNARPASPLAAVFRSNSGPYEEGNQVRRPLALNNVLFMLIPIIKLYLFYVNSSNGLAFTNFQTGSNWTPSKAVLNFSSVPPFTISQQPNSLAAAAIVQNELESGAFNFGVLLLVRASNGSVLFLYGYEYSPAEYRMSTLYDEVSYQLNFYDVSTTVNASFSNFGLNFVPGIAAGGGPNSGNTSEPPAVVSGVLLNCPVNESSAESPHSFFMQQLANSNASISQLRLTIS